MVTCAVSSCKNTSAKTTKVKDGITFHRFPRNQERRKKWELAVNREEEWVSTLSSAVCSEHFVARDFYLTESGLRRLATEALPTINISENQEDRLPTVPAIEPADISPMDSVEVVQLKYKVRRLTVIAADRKKRINLLWQSKKRMKKKIERLKSIIKHLVQNKKREDSN